MALNTAKAEATLRDITRTFDRSVQSSTPFYPSVCTIINSTGYDEKYAWLGDIPSVREWVGDRLFNEMRAADYTLANKLWEDSILIKKTDLADDRHGIYNPLAAMMGLRAAQHPDKLFFTALTTNGNCFDGQTFFSASHSFGDSGTQSNSLTLDAASGTTPTATEFKTAFRTAVQTLLGFVDDRGEPLHQPTVGRLNELICLIPLALRAQAYDAVESTVISQSSNVVIDTPTIVASPFLTDATKFYVFYTNQPLKPFVFQAREPISRQMKGLEDIETKDVKFMTQARYNVGYLAWWNSVLTTFT